MANLSPEAIARLIQDIDDLRRIAETAEGLIDQAKLKSRYDAATAGLLTADGKFDPPAWQNLSIAEQATRELSLTSLSRTLENWEEKIAIAPTSFMYKKIASNRAILGLTLFALLGLLLTLALVCHEWETATLGSRGILEFGTPSASTAAAKTQETGPILVPSPAPKERGALKSNPAPTPVLSVLSTPSSPTPQAADVPAPAGTTLTADSPAIPSSEKKDHEVPGKPTEQAVLWMVILMGALGGFLHLARSMAIFVGYRQLLRSWIIYYILIPFQGATLAPVIYLLLRVGILNPANTTVSGRPTESLNLIGIYAFAALTGLFTQQAVKVIGAVFDTIFKASDAKDRLDQ